MVSSGNDMLCNDLLIRTSVYGQSWVASCAVCWRTSKLVDEVAQLEHAQAQDRAFAHRGPPSARPSQGCLDK